MIKVAILSFYSGHLARGVETWTYELAKRLDPDVDVTVYQNGPLPKSPKYKTRSIGVNLNWSKKMSYIPFLNYYSLKVAEFTRKVVQRLDKDTDIVIPTNGQWQSLLIKFWAVRNKRKVIICGHSGPGFDDRINLFTFPDVFVSLTEFQANWARSVNPFVTVTKIPNGIDLNKFKEGENVARVNSTEPIILSVAAFNYWKRLDLAIKAVSRLNNGSLILVGKGEDEKKLKRLGDRYLPGRIKITSLPYDEMATVYSSARLFTYPTVPWESFGIALLEAMASNLPIVATDDPIRREIVGNAGLFVDPTKIDQYAKTIKKALDKDWGDLPRHQAEKFSWGKIKIKYIELFKSLI